jgi:hypothetical protein
VGNPKSVPDAELEALTREIARLEREAYVAGDRRRAAMCRDALAALFGRDTGRRAAAAVQACVAELDRRKTPS